MGVLSRLRTAQYKGGIRAGATWFTLSRSSEGIEGGSIYHYKNPKTECRQQCECGILKIKTFINFHLFSCHGVHERLSAVSLRTQISSNRVSSVRTPPSHSLAGGHPFAAPDGGCYAAAGMCL